MPDFEFTGPYPTTYPETRDAFGVNLGTVKPGDILRFDEAPDQFWHPYEGGDSGTEGDGGEPPADLETPPAPETPDVTPGA